MSKFIKTGYWEEKDLGLRKWLNLNKLIVDTASVLIANAITTTSTSSTTTTSTTTITPTYWDDLRAPASGINPAGQISPPSVNAADGSLTFSTSDAVCAWFQLPHAWKEGTDLNPHIHWSKTTSASGTVNWQIKYKWFNIGDVAGAFSSLNSGIDQVPNSDIADKHALMTFPIFSGVGKTISSMVCIYLVRTTSGDTYGADVNLYEIDLHYERDSNGSSQIYIK